MTRRVVIVMLVGINLVLLAVLVLSAYSPPQAMAQSVGRGGEFILVSAAAQVENDAIYLIDIRNRRLHAFRSTFPHVRGQPTRVALLHSRDLARDFGQ